MGSLFKMFTKLSIHFPDLNLESFGHCTKYLLKKSTINYNNKKKGGTLKFIFSQTSQIISK